MTDTNNITLTILKDIQATQADILKEVHHLRDDTNLQFAALNEKLSGQLISEIEFRQELQQLRERLRRVEKRLDLTNE